MALLHWSEDLDSCYTLKRDFLLPASTKYLLLSVPKFPRDVQVSLFIALTVKIHYQLAPSEWLLKVNLSMSSTASVGKIHTAKTYKDHDLKGQTLLPPSSIGSSYTQNASS